MINSSYLRLYYQIHFFCRFTEDIAISSLVFNLRSYYKGQRVFGRYSMILNVPGYIWMYKFALERLSNPNPHYRGYLDFPPFIRLLNHFQGPLLSQRTIGGAFIRGRHRRRRRRQRNVRFKMLRADGRVKKKDQNIKENRKGRRNRNRQFDLLADESHVMRSSHVIKERERDRKQKPPRTCWLKSGRGG